RIEASFARLASKDLAGFASAEEMAALRDASLLKRHFARDMVAMGESGQTDLARAAIASGEGKRLMDALRSQIERIDRREQTRLFEWTRQVEKASRGLQRRIETLQYFLIGLLVIAFAALVRA